MNARQARWLDFLREYDFEIKHIKGKENKVVDALSENPITSFIATISSYKTELDDKLEEGLKIDQEYHNLRERVTNNEFENLKTYYSLNEKGLMLSQKQTLCA